MSEKNEQRSRLYCWRNKKLARLRSLRTPLLAVVKKKEKIFFWNEWTTITDREDVVAMVWGTMREKLKKKGCKETFYRKRNHKYTHRQHTARTHTEAKAEAERKRKSEIFSQKSNNNNNKWISKQRREWEKREKRVFYEWINCRVWGEKKEIEEKMLRFYGKKNERSIERIQEKEDFSIVLLRNVLEILFLFSPVRGAGGRIKKNENNFFWIENNSDF